MGGCSYRREEVCILATTGILTIQAVRVGVGVEVRYPTLGVSYSQLPDAARKHVEV